MARHSIFARVLFLNVFKLVSFLYSFLDSDLSKVFSSPLSIPDIGEFVIVLMNVYNFRQ